jgi:hypothetical protein
LLTEVWASTCASYGEFSSGVYGEAIQDVMDYQCAEMECLGQRLIEHAQHFRKPIQLDRPEPD